MYGEVNIDPLTLPPKELMMTYPAVPATREAVEAIAEAVDPDWPGAVFTPA